jgi:hypothetical protein
MVSLVSHHVSICMHICTINVILNLRLYLCTMWLYMIHRIGVLPKHYEGTYNVLSYLEQLQEDELQESSGWSYDRFQSLSVRRMIRILYCRVSNILTKQLYSHKYFDTEICKQYKNIFSEQGAQWMLVGIGGGVLSYIIIFRLMLLHTNVSSNLS